MEQLVRGLGAEPGIDFEAPHGLSQGPVGAFEAMLEIHDPRDVTA